MSRLKSQWYKFFLFGIVFSFLLYFLPDVFNNLLYNIILIAVGGALVFAVLALPSQMKRARKSDLCGKGKLIKGKIIKVLNGKSSQHPTGLGLLYRSYYYLKCEYIDRKTKRRYYFYSRSYFFRFDPTQFLPTTVDVWVDPNNWKNYYVDLGTLPDDIIRGHAPVVNKIES